MPIIFWVLSRLRLPPFAPSLCGASRSGNVSQIFRLARPTGRAAGSSRQFATNNAFRRPRIQGGGARGEHVQRGAAGADGESRRCAEAGWHPPPRCGRRRGGGLDAGGAGGDCRSSRGHAGSAGRAGRGRPHAAHLRRRIRQHRRRGAARAGRGGGGRRGRGWADGGALGGLGGTRGVPLGAPLAWGQPVGAGWPRCHPAALGRRRRRRWMRRGGVCRHRRQPQRMGGRDRLAGDDTAALECLPRACEAARPAARLRRRSRLCGRRRRHGAALGQLRGCRGRGLRQGAGATRTRACQRTGRPGADSPIPSCGRRAAKGGGAAAQGSGAGHRRDGRRRSHSAARGRGHRQRPVNARPATCAAHIAA